MNKEEKEEKEEIKEEDKEKEKVKEDDGTPVVEEEKKEVKEKKKKRKQRKQTGQNEKLFLLSAYLTFYAEMKLEMSKKSLLTDFDYLENDMRDNEEYKKTRDIFGNLTDVQRLYIKTKIK
jgi:predicted ATP-dependent protease